jgi:hypothetical protein
MATQVYYTNPVEVDVEVVNNGIIEGRSTVKLQRGDRLLDEIQTINIAPNEVTAVQVSADDLQEADVGDVIDYRVLTENASVIVSVEVSDIPDSAISRWKFEQDVTDSWGNNHGTDNTSAGYVTGTVSSYAKDFDGSDDYVDLNYSPDTFDGKSLSLWFKTTEGSALTRIVAARDGDSLFVQNDNATLEYIVEDDGTSGNIASNFTIADGNWHHVVVMYGSNSMEMYLDDSSQGTDSVSITSTTLPNLYAGAWNDVEGGGIKSYYQGQIDDIRVYDKVLSSTEVSNLYNTDSISG